MGILQPWIFASSRGCKVHSAIKTANIQDMYILNMYILITRFLLKNGSPVKRPHPLKATSLKGHIPKRPQSKGHIPKRPQPKGHIPKRPQSKGHILKMPHHPRDRKAKTGLKPYFFTIGSFSTVIRRQNLHLLLNN